MVYDYYQHRGLCWLVCSIIVRLYLPSKRSLKNPLVPRIHCETSSRSAWESVKVLSRPCTVLRSGPYHNCIWREEEENFFPSIHPHAHQGKNPQKCSANSNNFLSFWFGAFLLVIATCYSRIFLKIVHYFSDWIKFFVFPCCFLPQILLIYREPHTKNC